MLWGGLGGDLLWVAVEVAMEMGWSSMTAAAALEYLGNAILPLLTLPAFHHSKARPWSAQLRHTAHRPLHAPAQQASDLWGPCIGGTSPGLGCPLGLPCLQAGETEEEEEEDGAGG